MDITSLTIKATADLLAKGEATSVAVTQAYLDRIDTLNPKLNAYLTVFNDNALEQAKASDARRIKGETLGVLDGVPLAFKDNYSTKGQRTTAASKILENHEPLYDATAVKKLKAVGAVILGKTNMDQFAMGSSTETSAFGNTANPWDTSRVPGGSSGGSAVAVAADLCAGALGSDTFGSIRQPAGYTSVIGLKPTYGAISRYGLLAMASSLDVVGPMTKSVRDAEILFDALKGQDDYDATTINNPQSATSNPKTMHELKIGIPKELFINGMDADVRQTIDTAIEKLQSLGAKIVEVILPTVKYSVPAYYVLCPVEIASNIARYDGIRYGESVEREQGSHTLLEVYKQTRSKYLGEEVKRRIMLGTYASSAGYYDAYYNKAMKVRSLIKKEMDEVFETVDCLVTPVSPSVAFKFGEKGDDPIAMYLEDIFTGPVNLAGVPALVAPAGFVLRDGKKLPVGIQFIGPDNGEATLFAVGSAYEQATSWSEVKPQL